AVIGRPNNVGGIEELAQLVSHWPTELIVIAENDEKPDGHWPGRDGAIAVAEGLTAKLGRPMAWALTTDGDKDAQSWLTHRISDKECLDSWCVLGEQFVARLEKQPVQPSEQKPASSPAPLVPVPP